MAKYVVLTTWTEQGAKSATETIDRAAKVRQLAEDLGGSTDLLLWTLGRYDIVGVFDMPSDEAMAALGLRVGGMGAVRTETLRAFTAEELGPILEGLASGSSDAPSRGGSKGSAS
jgi:uncharacterized protein with GYD domain